MKKIPLSSPTYGLVSNDKFLAQFERLAKAKEQFQSQEQLLLTKIEIKSKMANP